uniref:Uncharacterized protein n=1 Tax=Anguilla anguilla TaxID=7936 RepID=A0A0E9Q3C2_ANGAN
MEVYTLVFVSGRHLLLYNWCYLFCSTVYHRSPHFRCSVPCEVVSGFMGDEVC